MNIEYHFTRQNAGKKQGEFACESKNKISRLWSILLALVMVVGMLPTTALAEEPDAFLQFADAPGENNYL